MQLGAGRFFEAIYYFPLYKCSYLRTIAIARDHILHARIEFDSCLCVRRRRPIATREDDIPHLEPTLTVRTSFLRCRARADGRPLFLCDAGILEGGIRDLAALFPYVLISSRNVIKRNPTVWTMQFLPVLPIDVLADINNSLAPMAPETLRVMNLKRTSK